MGRNAMDETSGYLRQQRYVLHDRDTKFCEEFRETLAALSDLSKRFYSGVWSCPQA